MMVAIWYLSGRQVVYQELKCVFIELKRIKVFTTNKIRFIIGSEVILWKNHIQLEN